MKKQMPSILNIGTSSILMIFILLCLVSFSTLSLLTSRSDYQLSKKSAERLTSYYEAQNAAKNMLETIDTVLANEYENLKAPDETAFYQAVSLALASQEGLTLTQEDDSPQISFSFPSGEEQQLLVTLKVTFPEEEGEGFYKITKWAAENTREWNLTGGVL